MAKKLTDITTSYSKFAEQQILTHEQLNKFLDYFDEQDRLSRICLSGVGIACGFELSVDRNNAITIFQGAGVTTDGDLIHLVAKEEPADIKKEVDINTLKDILVDKIKYEYYRDYDIDKVKYHPHFNKNQSIKDFDSIPLIEIVSKENKRDTDQNLQTLDLSNKVALFYLECYPKEPDSCLTIDCESQGIEQVNNLRVLLVDVEHINRIIRTDSLFNSYTTLESYLETKTVYVPRVILNESNTSTATKLAADYQDTTLLNTSVTNIRSGMKTILRRMDRSADAARFDDDMKRIFPTNEDTNLILFQYKYDLLKDLADSYNELKELFLLNYATCCPDIKAFPKHLLLGRLSEINQDTVDFITAPISNPIKLQPDVIDEIGVIANLGRRIAAPTYKDVNSYRHKFHKSPILLDSDEGNGRFESVLARILTMVSTSGFYNSSEFDTEIIRITPSNVRVPLGKRAVPFYYRFNNDLMLNWDFDKREYNRYKSILGYRQASAYSLIPHIANPLQYSIDPYDFYRIEGHQGNPYDQVFESLTVLKETYSLPFDIKVLGINVTEFDELLASQYKCDFKDLGVLLKAWSEEQICIAKEVADILSSFSTETPGANIKVNDYFDLTKNVALSKSDGLSKTDESNFKVSADLTTASKTFETFRLADETYSSSVESKATVNPILSYINTEPNTVGYFVNKAIADANGNYGNATAFALNDVEALISQWDRHIADSTVTLPTKITLACTGLIDFLPTTITELTDSTLDSYNVQIDVLCGYTKQLQSKYQQGDKISAVAQDTRSMISLLINQLTSICCSSKKLQALLEEVTNRKNSIIERLNFQNFAERNPGLEHKAGAGPGNTFVIVYINESVTESTGFTNINVFPGLSGALTTSVGTLSNSPQLTAISPFTSKTDASAGTGALSTSRAKLTADTDLSASRMAVDPSLIGVSNNLGISDGLLIDPSILLPSTGEKIIIPKGTVIADFTLPYLCCSDCAPINFVLPNIPVSLILSDNTYCLDDSNKEIDLTVSPPGGTVTVVDSVPGIVITGNKLTIDSTIFPTELLGTTLKFKVDGEETNAELLVSKKPDVDFIIPDVGANRNVSFTVTGVDSPDFSYNWNFGDGNTSTEREPTHDYSDAGVTKNFTVVLTVETTAGICPTVISHPLNFVDVNISIANSVCEDGIPIPFVIIPEGTPVDIEGEGLNPEKTHFDPSLVGPGSYEMSSDGVVFETITVNPKPVITAQIAAHINKTESTLEFTVETTDAIGFQWNAELPGDVKRTSKKATFSILLDLIDKLNAGDEIKVSVVVSNPCGIDEANFSWFVPEVNAATATLAEPRFCKDDKTPHAFTIENFTANTVITGQGVDDTVSPPTFTAANAEVGTHQIKVDDVVTDTVTVVAQPVLQIQEPISSTANGFSVVGIIPSDVDMSTLVWTFTHPETNDDLHEPIEAVKNTPVLLKNFLSQDWTVVKVTLTSEVEPCPPVSVSASFTRPLDIGVGLLTLDYCENDPNPYDFIFVPDDGSVTFEVVTGVSTDGRSLLPGELTTGSHVLTATNNKAVTVIIHPRPILPTPTVQLNASETGIDVSTTFPSAVLDSTIVWTFMDPENNVELHSSQFGASASVEFGNFNSESWLTVEVTVTADIGPCLAVSSSEIFDKPEEVIVDVSLETLTYCKGDSRETFFTYQPNIPSPVNGPVGLNSSGTGFFPNQLPVGTTTFTAESGQQIIVEIFEPVFGTLNPSEYLVETNTLKLSYTESGPVSSTVTWTIGTEKLGTLAQSNDNPWDINLNEFDISAGTVVNYSMLLSSEFCDDQTDSGTFEIPSISAPCKDKLLNGLNILDSEKPTPTQLNTQFKDTKKVGDVLSIYLLLSDLMDDPDNVINGSFNTRVVTELHEFIDFLAIELKLAKESDNATLTNMLTKLYRMAVEMYALAFFCQNKVNFETFTAGSAFNAKLISHFSAKALTSLIRDGIIVFTALNKGRLEAIIVEKGDTDEPWLTIDFVIKAKLTQA